MSREFEMSMMGELQYFLGLQIKQVKDRTFVHHTKYMKDMLRKFQMQDVKPVDTHGEYGYFGCGRGWRTTGPAGVPEHDRLPPLPNGDEARHIVQCVSVRSFSGFAKDIT
jgi:hypothetical protein